MCSSCHIFLEWPLWRTVAATLIMIHQNHFGHFHDFCYGQKCFQVGTWAFNQNHSPSGLRFKNCPMKPLPPEQCFWPSLAIFQQPTGILCSSQKLCPLFSKARALQALLVFSFFLFCCIVHGIILEMMIPIKLCVSPGSEMRFVKCNLSFTDWLLTSHIFVREEMVAVDLSIAMMSGLDGKCAQRLEAQSKALLFPEVNNSQFADPVLS
ncbi:hypothetical protein VNO77_24624 [Canavalia gladiata]|uniref:Uncharacterized protein n=1 Tax=Canavalia gladiata TaxID=3824 RepID=A0AAN9L6P2_CANGL